MGVLAQADHETIEGETFSADMCSDLTIFPLRPTLFENEPTLTETDPPC